MNFLAAPHNSSAKCPLPAGGPDLETKRSSSKLAQRNLKDSLCFSCFPSVLENTDANPVLVLQLLKQSRLFMNEAQEGEERACVTPAVGWVMHFIHSQPFSPGWILKDIVHFGWFKLDFPPPGQLSLHQDTKHVCAFLGLFRVFVHLVGETVGEVNWEKGWRGFAVPEALVTSGSPCHPRGGRRGSCAAPESESGELMRGHCSLGSAPVFPAPSLSCSHWAAHYFWHSKPHCCGHSVVWIGSCVTMPAPLPCHRFLLGAERRGQALS